MKITDLVPVCVLPTENKDVLYLHKDDLDRDMSVCLFIYRNPVTEIPSLVMHQTQMYLTRSLIDYEIEDTPENIKFYLDLMSRKFSDDYIADTLDRFEKFREEYYKSLETDEDIIFDLIDKYNKLNDTDSN